MTQKVTVIVLNWNGESDTAACIDSLLVQEGVALEVLLVDNDSSDGSGARLSERYPGVQYLQTGANLGYAGGNNRGLAWAMQRGAEWVLVCNNDTVAEPQCVRLLLAAAQADERIAALAPLIVRFDAPDRVWFAGGTFSVARGMGNHDHEGETVDEVERRIGTEQWQHCTFLTGCCLLIRVRALEAVGMFREDFFAYVEDVDLSLRLRRAGWRLGWVPRAHLAHRVPTRHAPPSPIQITLRDRNRRRMVRDRYPWYLRAVFAAWFWPTRLISLGRYLLGRDWPRARAILEGMTAH